MFSNELFWYSETKTFLLSIKIFSLPEIFWNTEWFPGEVFYRSCEIKKFSTKPWSFAPPLLEIFRSQNSFETQKCSPTNFIGTVRQKNFNGVQWYPLLMHKILRYAKFSETPNCSPTKFFGTVWQKFSTEKRDTPSLMHKVFRYPKFSDTPKCSPTKFSGTVRQKKLNKKWYPLFCIKYRNRKFS